MRRAGDAAASTSATARRLRDLAEPIAGCVYFVPETLSAYEALGLDYIAGYFCSRGASLGRPSGEVVAAAFGVFNPEVVVPAVRDGWARTDPDTILEARIVGAGRAIRRLAGEPDTSRIVAILRPVMESADTSGRMLFAGLRSLEFPTDPIAQLWRVCDYIRERRGDGHIAAWVGAGCDAVEIGLLTELYWGMGAGTYIYTRGWTPDQVHAGLARLEDAGLVREGAFTDEGMSLRRSIETATDRMDADVVDALGDDAGELFGLLAPITAAVVAGGGYPVDPARFMSRDG